MRSSPPSPVRRTTMITSHSRTAASSQAPCSYLSQRKNSYFTKSMVKPNIIYCIMDILVLQVLQSSQENCSLSYSVSYVPQLSTGLGTVGQHPMPYYWDKAHALLLGQHPTPYYWGNTPYLITGATPHTLLLGQHPMPTTIEMSIKQITFYIILTVVIICDFYGSLNPHHGSQHRLFLRKVA